MNYWEKTSCHRQKPSPVMVVSDSQPSKNEAIQILETVYAETGHEKHFLVWSGHVLFDRIHHEIISQISKTNIKGKDIEYEIIDSITAIVERCGARVIVFSSGNFDSVDLYRLTSDYYDRKYKRWAKEGYIPDEEIIAIFGFDNDLDRGYEFIHYRDYYEKEEERDD